MQQVKHIRILEGDIKLMNSRNNFYSISLHSKLAIANDKKCFLSFNSISEERKFFSRIPNEKVGSLLPFSMFS
jgi:hypothetical protein